MKMYYKLAVLFLAVILFFVACSNDAKKISLLPFGMGTTDSSRAMENFYFMSPLAMGIIDETAHTVAVTVPYGTNVTALVPTIIHNGKSVSPDSGTAQNFYGPVNYTVTAEDGSTQDYAVTVTVAGESAPSISAFYFTSPMAMGTINQASHTISVIVPYGTDVTAMAPTIIHTGESVSPNSGTARDFSGPVTYTVTAADTSTQDYTVTVIVASGTAPSISAFFFMSPLAMGVIDETDHTIAVTVPHGTDVTTLVPTVIHTGASVSPVSGTQQNFSGPVTYRVTAADTSTQDYTVTVSIASGVAPALSAFFFASPVAIGTINDTNHTVAVTVPYGTDVTALVPTVVHNGASVNPASGAVRNFTSQVTYRVTAADTSTQDYTVTVTVAARSAKAITAFNLTSPASRGYVNEVDHTIEVILPYGTAVTALAPAITHNGASVSPASGTARNFSSPVTYTVTAADGSTQNYAATVTVAANTAKEITSYSFTSPAVTGVISGTSITLTVSNDTNLTGVVANFTTTGASVTVTQTGSVQVSGTTPNNFTTSRTYRVTAANGTTQDYTVTVNKLPAVSTTAIAGNLSLTLNIAGSNATVGGNVTNVGSSAVYMRGICWNTTGSPTVSDNSVSSGSGTGAFTSAISGLSANTAYHLRAYAINSQGLAYGNEVTFNSGYAFGTDHAGGYVFYNDGNGGGLVCAKTDQSEGLKWYNGSYITTGASGTAIGTGQTNTTLIVTSQGMGSYAAQICNDYSDGTYSDWFLPSLDELSAIYNNILLCGKNILFCDGGNYIQHWSSTERNATSAWVKVVLNGEAPYNPPADKNSIQIQVRAARAF